MDTETQTKVTLIEHLPQVRYYAEETYLSPFREL